MRLLPFFTAAQAAQKSRGDGVMGHAFFTAAQAVVFLVLKRTLQLCFQTGHKAGSGQASG